MCGITGIIAFTEQGKKYLDKIDDAVKSLHHRGPDGHGVFRHGKVALGHTRLAIIDTSNAAAQPFTSSDGRFTIVFNGEIFNYKELRDELEKDGCVFRSQSDTEVLLTLYAKEGKNCLGKLNGFFAFLIYDKQTESLFASRDGAGEKPLYAYQDKDVCIFGSELRAIYSCDVPRTIEPAALTAYLHLNYIPPGFCIDKQVSQIPASAFANFSSEGNREIHQYTVERDLKKYLAAELPNYSTVTKTLRNCLEAAVERRLVSDVPLGSFLSGGMDSSIVAAMAAKHVPKLQTFSIGFPDEPRFDETQHAIAVSKYIGSDHHVFGVTNKELLENVNDFLAHIDEPFADSSALAVNILAKETRKHVTVALSGDGADEMFAGYNKHRAEYSARYQLLTNLGMTILYPIAALLPSSRNSNLGNKANQLKKYTRGLWLSRENRYWQWAGFTTDRDLYCLIGDGTHNKVNERMNFLKGLEVVKKTFTASIKHGSYMNDVLNSDVINVLQGDMLVKTDRFSMRHGLEIRPPFLDPEMIQLAKSLPSSAKITRFSRKKILKDACLDLLPGEIFTRRKQGFEVPLLQWFRGDLRGLIDELLDETFLKEQGLFNPEEVKNIRKQLHSNNPGDTAARIWGLIVFQSWWKKYLG
jgi:asparagine synthase (glutamine-hydrolysing)